MDDEERDQHTERPASGVAHEEFFALFLEPMGVVIAEGEQDADGCKGQKCIPGMVFHILHGAENSQRKKADIS